MFGRIVGEAAAAYSAQLPAQQRSASALAEARAEVDELLAANGPANVRWLQRAIRDIMTERAGVVRSGDGLLAGLAELEAVEARIPHVGVHPDLAGFHDLAHGFDLKASALAARATLEAALERRETRGCHNRSDYPAIDESLQVNTNSGRDRRSDARCLHCRQTGGIAELRYVTNERVWAHLRAGAPIPAEPENDH